ncbi:MAG: type IV secretory system conjugative DNA transfer family protein [Candidatus Competibacteraceae bacterium]|nr:type IV secretory system conjugative DNA transfer family protein [Candidatus Competibacteraceae bacterium]
MNTEVYYFGYKHIVHGSNFGERLFKIMRPLNSMSDIERECCRFARILYVLGFINAEVHDAILRGIIYNNANSSIQLIKFTTKYTYLSPEKMTKGDWRDTAIAQLTAAGVERPEQSVAIATTIFDQILENMPQSEPAAMLKARLRAGNSWLSAEDISESPYNDGDVQLMLGTLAGTDIKLGYGGEGSLVTIAPSGSGKSQCHVIPNLLNYPGPVVVLDVKGECFEKTAGWRANNVGPVYRFAPFDPVSSAGFNPLTFVRSDPMYVWDDAVFLADMLVVTQSKKDPTWEETAKNLIATIIAWAAIYKDEPDMQNVLDVLANLEWQNFIDQSIEGEKSPQQLRRRANSFAETADRVPKQMQGVLQEANRHLSVWEFESVARVTDRSDWHPDSLRTAPYPSVYICVETGKTETYASLLRVMIGLQIRALTKTLPERGGMPILFMLDEMPQLGFMRPVLEALEIGRQYGIKAWMFAQNMGQIRTIYPDGDGMVGGCAVRIFMNPSLEDNTAQKVSERLGVQESVLDGKSYPLAEPTALAGPEYKNLQIVFATGALPAKVSKDFVHSDPNYADRIGLSTS